MLRHLCFALPALPFTDTVKLNISGEEIEEIDGVKDVKSTFDADDTRAVVAESHRLGMRVAAHCRGSKSVRDGLAAGIDVMFHCDFTTRECREGIVAAPDLLLGPSLGFLDRIAPFGIEGDPRFDAPAKLAASIETHLHLLEMGGKDLVSRVGIGGDYGFAVTPHGDNAYDCELYVRLLGMTPLDALRCATTSGARFMRGSPCGDEGNGPRIGELCAGFAADLIAVRGDATVDVRCLREVELVISNGRLARLEPGLGAAASAPLCNEALEGAFVWASANELRELLIAEFVSRFPEREDEAEIALSSSLGERKPLVTAKTGGSRGYGATSP